jgi:hypothetical protein
MQSVNPLADPTITQLHWKGSATLGGSKEVIKGRDARNPVGKACSQTRLGGPEEISNGREPRNPVCKARSQNRPGGPEEFSEGRKAWNLTSQAREPRRGGILPLASAKQGMKNLSRTGK